MNNPTKIELFARGEALMTQFCQMNSLPIPQVNLVPSRQWRFAFCAYYRPMKIEICLAKCAAIGVAGPAWSYPGYTVDRTPYGVLQHELGHHVDVMKGEATSGYTSHFSRDIRKQSGEAKLTNYCPNNGEWFAEMFRLFVTNPDLLRALRPVTYGLLLDHFTPVVNQNWAQVLQDAPTRTMQAALKKVLT